MKFDYQTAIRRIVQGNCGFQLATDNGVFRFPTEQQCLTAELALKSQLPEVRTYRTSDIMVTTPPNN